MAQVSLAHITKQFGSVDVLKGIDLEIEDGEFMVFVGPSGCGKTTLLRCIAGLDEPSSGRIVIDGEEANDKPPARRGVAMVFQSYALYPHMTVAENMGFGLKFQRLGKAEIAAAVQRAAEILQMTELLPRKPRELSGGQRQRVAIGRAIVRHPKVFLFDEPLSNLDAALRLQMRVELARLHRELGTTMIYVTHDQVEAMTLGTRIAVFNAGRIEQVGRPIDLYRRPATRFVAGFLGSPKMNFLPGRIQGEGDSLRISLGDAGDVALGRAAAVSGRSRDATLGVRPEHLELSDGHDGLRAIVDQVEHLGDCDVAYARLLGIDEPVSFKLREDTHDLAPGASIRLRAAPQNCHLFDEAGLAFGA